MHTLLLALLLSALGQDAKPPAPPSETCAIEKVVDADTIHVKRKGAIEKLRLLSVDAEEKFSSFTEASGTKPATVFGEESAQWARTFFAGLAKEGETPSVGLLFPNGREQRDVYGRLLCHVLLPDGTDFNLLLVERGISPYFNKYGNDEIRHADFVAAQARAQEHALGIWNPQTNRAQTQGAPEARRPYDKLLPWWNARAAAIDAFRARQKADPDHAIDAEWPPSLERGAATSAKDDVEVFGSIERLFDEDSGDWTVLMRSGEKERALRVRIPKSARGAFAKLELERLNDEFRQNYVIVRGKLRDTGRGFEMRCSDPEAWRLAGPEPVLPKPAPTPAGADR